MVAELRVMGRRRKIVGWSQKRLGMESGLSQSMINKMENGRINPSYEAVIRVDAALSRAEHMGVKTAKDLMNKRIISVKEGDRVSESAKKMREYDISQMPVYNQAGVMVGSICEQTLTNAIAGELTGLTGLSVAEIMEEPHPTTGEDTPITTIAHILNHSPAVILTKGPKHTGIITRADLLTEI